MSGHKVMKGDHGSAYSLDVAGCYSEECGRYKAHAFMRDLCALLEKYGVREIDLTGESGGHYSYPNDITFDFEDYTIPSIGLGTGAYTRWIRKQVDAANLEAPNHTNHEGRVSGS